MKEGSQGRAVTRGRSQGPSNVCRVVCLVTLSLNNEVCHWIPVVLCGHVTLSANQHPALAQKTEGKRKVDQVRN